MEVAEDMVAVHNDVAVTNDMQAKYPKRQQTRWWDPLRLEYPVRKFPGTGKSSKTIGHDWKPAPEVLKEPKDPLACIKEYFHDYNVERNLMRSQSSLDFGYKHGETKRHNKHTSCNENLYIYPPSRRIADRPPQLHAHGTSEMKDAYQQPTTPARLVTEKEQFIHPAKVPTDPPPLEPSWHKDLEPLDTTYEGFEKYLDPYLTTTRLHHRPYTADQLERESNAPARTIVTYYTFSDTPMTRTPKTKSEFWRLPLPRPKTVYDREKFKDEFREIRTHNKSSWVPGSFRTEVKDNFTSFTEKPEYRIHNYEHDVQSMYKQGISSLPPNKETEYAALLKGYRTEYCTMGSRKPLCSVLDPYRERNRRLELKENRRILNAKAKS